MLAKTETPIRLSDRIRSMGGPKVQSDTDMAHPLVIQAWIQSLELCLSPGFPKGTDTRIAQRFGTAWQSRVRVHWLQPSRSYSWDWHCCSTSPCSILVCCSSLLGAAVSLSAAEIVVCHSNMLPSSFVRSQPGTCS